MRTDYGIVGLIAGGGDLPAAVAEELARAGIPFFVAALEGEARKKGLASRGRRVEWIPPGRLQDLISRLRAAGVSSVALAGRVAHQRLYAGGFDARFSHLLSALTDRSGPGILHALADELTREGFRVLPTPELAPRLVPPPGLFAGPPPTPAQWEDASFGWDRARELARLDIGQTLAVRDRAVVAVEAMEGTDAAIARAGKLTGGGFTVVKVAGPRQDMRFDLPTAGPATVLALSRAGGALLALEAGRSLLLGGERTARLCREKGISLILMEKARSRGRKAR